MPITDRDRHPPNSAQLAWPPHFSPRHLTSADPGLVFWRSVHVSGRVRPRSHLRCPMVMPTAPPPMDFYVAAEVRARGGSFAAAANETGVDVDELRDAIRTHPPEYRK